MNIKLFKKINKPKHKKDGRINPHTFLILFMIVFLVVIIAEVVYFTYFFVVSSRKLDAPVEPSPDINTGQIKKIEQIIKKTEDAVSARQGVVPTTQSEGN